MVAGKQHNWPPYSARGTTVATAAAGAAGAAAGAGWLEQLLMMIFCGVVFRSRSVSRSWPLGSCNQSVQEKGENNNKATATSARAAAADTKGAGVQRNRLLCDTLPAVAHHWLANKLSKAY